jgi:hypothetical protein
MCGKELTIRCQLTYKQNPPDFAGTSAQVDKALIHPQRDQGVRCPRPEMRPCPTPNNDGFFVRVKPR